MADKTNANPDADEMLRLLGNTGEAIPFVAIFPAANPNKPILLDGLITPGQIQKALQQAGPSRPEGDTATAMRPSEAVAK